MTVYTVPTPAELDAITHDKIERVYSGLQGCMCGCKGSYSTNKAQVTKVLRALKNDPRVLLQDGYILHIDDKKRTDADRNRVVYLKRV